MKKAMWFTGIFIIAFVLIISCYLLFFREKSSKMPEGTFVRMEMPEKARAEICDGNAHIGAEKAWICLGNVRTGAERARICLENVRTGAERAWICLGNANTGAEGAWAAWQRSA